MPVTFKVSFISETIQKIISEIKSCILCVSDLYMIIGNHTGLQQLCHLLKSAENFCVRLEMRISHRHIISQCEFAKFSFSILQNTPHHEYCFHNLYEEAIVCIASTNTFDSRGRIEELFEDLKNRTFSINKHTQSILLPNFISPDIFQEHPLW